MRVIFLSYHLTSFLGTDFKQPVHLFMADVISGSPLRETEKPSTDMKQQVRFLLSKVSSLSSKRQSKTALRNYADYNSLATCSALVPQGGSEGLCCVLSSVLLNFHQCLHDTDFLRGHKDLCYGPLDE